MTSYNEEQGHNRYCGGCDECQPPAVSDSAGIKASDLISADTPEGAALRELVRAVEHYADRANWINEREFRGFPGFHGRDVAANALVKVAQASALIRAAPVRDEQRSSEVAGLDLNEREGRTDVGA